MFANNQTARMFRKQNSVGVESTCPLIGEINDYCFIANIHFCRPARIYKKQIQRISMPNCERNAIFTK